MLFRAMMTIALIAAAGCAQEQTTDMAVSAGSEPDVSERGIQVGPAGLAELVGKVAGRDDAECSMAGENVQLCVVKDGAEAYVYTQDGHPAHVAALFRGLVERDGEIVFEERGWYASDEAAAQVFFDEAAAMVPVLTIGEIE